MMWLRGKINRVSQRLSFFNGKEYGKLQGLLYNVEENSMILNSDIGFLGC